MPTTVIIRQAIDPTEVDQYKTFLQEQKERATQKGKEFPLPIPLEHELERACECGDLYIALSDKNSRVVACAGSFHVANSIASQHAISVFDLGGTAVDPAVGGMSPSTIQDVLLWTRTVGHAIQGRPGKSGLSILASAMHDNPQSWRSLERNGFARVAPAPDWLSEMTKDWANRKEVRHYYLPSSDLQIHAKNLLNCNLRDYVELSRTNRDTGLDEKVRLSFDIDWMKDYLSVVSRIHREEGFIALSALPEKAQQVT